MARGKWLLTMGLLLAGGLLRLEAQQVGSSPGEGTSGWAVDRVQPPPVRSYPVLPPPYSNPPPAPAFTPPPQYASNPGYVSAYPPPAMQATATTMRGAAAQPLNQTVAYYQNVPPNPGMTPTAQTGSIQSILNDVAVPESDPALPASQGTHTEPPLATTLPPETPSPVPGNVLGEMIPVRHQILDQQPLLHDAPPAQTLPPLAGEQLPPLESTQTESNQLQPTRLPQRTGTTSIPSNAEVTPSNTSPTGMPPSLNQSQFGLDRAEPPPVPRFQPGPSLDPAMSTTGSAAPANQEIMVTSSTPPEVLPPVLPAHSPAVTVTRTPEQPLDADLLGWVDPTRAHYYFRGEYLLWWTKNDHVPPLVTTGPALLTPQGGPDGATLDRADTTVLFGGDGLNRGAQSGVRLTAGWWCDETGKEAIELSGFFLPQRSTNFSASSNQYPQLSRPFTDEITGTQSAQDTTFPGVAVGSVSVHAPSQLWGLEANLRCKLCCGESCWGAWRIDAIGGPRYLNLTESISITEDTQFTNNPNLGPYANQTDIVNDSFATRNQFIGGQVGVDAQYYWKRWSVDLRAKLGLGYNDQSLVIQGSQSLPDQLDSRQGGLLALATNIGRYGKDEFSIVPEVGVNVGYQFTDHLRAMVGYNFLGWTSVLRPGEQINTTLDASLIPQFPTTPVGPHNEPSVPFKESSYWAQGLTVGLEFRY